jgi:hypothetical protein
LIRNRGGLLTAKIKNECSPAFPNIPVFNCDKSNKKVFRAYSDSLLSRKAINIQTVFSTEYMRYIADFTGFQPKVPLNC